MKNRSPVSTKRDQCDLRQVHFVASKMLDEVVADGLLANVPERFE